MFILPVILFATTEYFSIFDQLAGFFSMLHKLIFSCMPAAISLSATH